MREIFCHRHAIPFLALSLFLSACGRGGETQVDTSSVAARTPVEFFVDETAERGISFRFSSGATGKHWMPEQLGGGAAFADFNGDGDLDLFLVNGGPLPGAEMPAENALYKNLGGGRFELVANAGGMACGTDYGVGCTVADIDLDGDLDVFITNWGQDRLFRNDGDFRFTDISIASGIESNGWGASAAFGDFDADGWPDLYITKYLVYDIKKHEPCFQREFQIYCGPQPYPGQADVLYMNRNGKFVDETGKRLNRTPNGKGLGLAVSDFENDGDLDIYVANDQTPNFLWKNDGKGFFSEVANWAGVAVSKDGLPEAGMGVAWDDLNNDLQDDIVVTNFEDQTNSIYMNDGDGAFTESSFQCGVGYESRPLLGWGVGLVDFDQDGWKDLFYVNGHIYENADKLRDSSTWAMRSCLHFNQGNGTFRRASDSGVAVLDQRWPSRASAFGDVDNDGDIDVLVTRLDNRPVLLINHGARGRWLLCEAKSSTGAQVAGVRFELIAGGRSQTKVVVGGSSYLAHNELRAHFGLGESTHIEELVVTWTGGKKHRYGPIESNHLVSVTPDGQASIKTLANRSEIRKLSAR